MEPQQASAKKVIESPAYSGEGFDTRTHISDAVTGRLIKLQPYRLFVRDEVRYFERPKLSGNLFFENGTPAGRMIGGKLDPHAEHVLAAEVAQPITPDEMLEKNAALEAEIAALRAEKEALLKAQKKPEPVQGKLTVPAKQ